jgi:predicted porin
VKKFISIVSAMLLVFGFAASALAIHAEIPSETQAVVAKGGTQITLGGELRVRGEIQQNTSDFYDDTSDRKSYYDQRVRLRLQADVTKNTTGVIHLEGGSATGDNFTWGGSNGDATSGAKGIYASGNAKKTSLYVLEAWIQHTGSGLLGIPAGLKVGHMPLKLGNGLFFAHDKFGDDAIVLFADPTKELHIGLLTAKFAEGTDTANNDADAYVGLLIYKPNKDTSVGLDITYVDDKKSNGLGGITIGNGVNAVNIPTHLWNFGLRGNTTVSGLGIYADVELQNGKIEYDKVTGQTETKLRGYAYMVGLNYKIDPVKVELEYAYGSGDDDATDNKNKNFVTSLGADKHFTYVYEYRTKNAQGTANGGLVNTQYVKLGLSSNLTKDLSGEIQGYWLRANKKYSTAYDSKNIGTEIDAKVSYKIDKNLVYWVEGGYLWAGNFFKNFTGDTSTAKKVDDAYAVRHGIQLNF